MRDQFTEPITKKMTELKKVYSKIFISWDLNKERNRSQISLRYPEAKLVLINAPRKMILS